MLRGTSSTGEDASLRTAALRGLQVISYQDRGRSGAQVAAGRRQMAGTTRKTDVFIVGGGPAGVAAGIAARQKGLSVLVADGAEPPIDKPCGEGLMPETLASLRSLGVEINPLEGHPLRGIRFLHQDTRIHANFQGCEGIGIRRPLLHERMLAKAVECGVQLLWKTPVAGMSERGVQLRREFVEARWVIGADGSGSRVRRWSGLDSAAKKSQRHATRRHIACGRGRNTWRFIGAKTRRRT